MPLRRSRRTLATFALTLSTFLALGEVRAQGATTLELSGLLSPVRIVRDESGVPHIFAANERDLLFAQGFVHAQDRLFQMDSMRRMAEGTLAELLGPPALPSDIQVRLLGVGRNAEETLDRLSPATRSGLRAYAAGVNAVLASRPLPPEYTPLELTRIRSWTPEDSVRIARLIAFGLALDLSDLPRTATLMSYQAAGAAQGFDGQALFFEDTNPIAPFDPATVVPDASRDPAELGLPAVTPPRRRGRPRAAAAFLEPATLRLVRRMVERLERLQMAGGLSGLDKDRGSNAFVVSGARSATGMPILANDPHLPLGAPSVFYPVHLSAPRDGFEVAGSSFPGAPYVALGHNQNITWGATVNPLDLTDVYQEQLVLDFRSPSLLSTVFDGTREPVVLLPQIFRANTIGDGVLDSIVVIPPGPLTFPAEGAEDPDAEPDASGAASADDMQAAPLEIPPFVPIVPRRNAGPIVELDLESGLAISVQFTGTSPGSGLDGIRGLNLARNFRDFVGAVQRIDIGSQNLLYADRRGNIAYVPTGELPLREDLEQGTVVGTPPFLIRNGQGGNEWVPARSFDRERALGFEILPFAEMPQLLNPPLGVVTSANNDTAGTTLDNDPLNEMRPSGGILYLSDRYAPGIRAGRITRLLDELLRSGKPIRADDLRAIQADVVLSDAGVFRPFLLDAFERAQRSDAPAELRRLASDPRIREAVERIRAWDLTSPTGIPEGFDASDTPTSLEEPSESEISNSIATTLYSTWRTDALESILVATLERRGLELFSGSGEPLTGLRRLLERFEDTEGLGESGLDFFEVPGIPDARDRRDLILLRSLASALDRLAGDDFAAAFDHSTRQEDYRWGLLHRAILDHPLGEPFSIPPAGGAFPAPLAARPEGSLGAGLPGIPIDGGLFTVDVANTAGRPRNVEEHVVRAGPARRFVAEIQAGGRGIRAESSLPGGQSGVLGSPLYVNRLIEYLTNETSPLISDSRDLVGRVGSEVTLVPAR